MSYKNNKEKLVCNSLDKLPCHIIQSLSSTESRIPSWLNGCFFSPHIDFTVVEYGFGEKGVRIVHVNCFGQQIGLEGIDFGGV